MKKFLIRTIANLIVGIISAFLFLLIVSCMAFIANVIEKNLFLIIPLFIYVIYLILKEI